MTYLSVIAAAGAAALIAASAQADVATGQTSGKRIHKPMTAAATGQASGKRVHKPLAVNKMVDQASPKLLKNASGGPAVKPATPK